MFSNTQKAVTSLELTPDKQFRHSIMNQGLEDFPSVQGLGLSTSTTESLGSIPAQGTKTPQGTRHSQKKKTRGRNIPSDPLKKNQSLVASIKVIVFQASTDLGHMEKPFVPHYSN